MNVESKISRKSIHFPYIPGSSVPFSRVLTIISFKLYSESSVDTSYDSDRHSGKQLHNSLIFFLCALRAAFTQQPDFAGPHNFRALSPAAFYGSQNSLVFGIKFHQN